VGVAVVIQVLEVVLSDRLGAKTQTIMGMDLELISDKKSVPSFLPSFPSSWEMNRFVLDWIVIL